MTPVLLSPATDALPTYGVLSPNKIKPFTSVGWPTANRDESITTADCFSGSPEWVFTAGDLVAGFARKWLPFAGVFSGIAPQCLTPEDEFSGNGRPRLTSDHVFAGKPGGSTTAGNKFSGRPDDPFTQRNALEITTLRTETTRTRFRSHHNTNRPLKPFIYYGK